MFPKFNRVKFRSLSRLHHISGSVLDLKSNGSNLLTWRDMGGRGVLSWIGGVPLQSQIAEENVSLRLQHDKFETRVSTRQSLLKRRHHIVIHKSFSSTWSSSCCDYGVEASGSLGFHILNTRNKITITLQRVCLIQHALQLLLFCWCYFHREWKYLQKRPMERTARSKQDA